MRTVSTEQIQVAVAAAVVEANTRLPADVVEALEGALAREESPLGRQALAILVENARIARCEGLALCQDTGMVSVHLALGQEVHLTGRPLQEAIDAGVAQGYRQGYLRASVVRHPLVRENTGDNTPALVHCEVVPGDRLSLTVMPKGAGSENMGRVAMLTPSQGREAVERFVVETVAAAGGNPCPPVIVGVGLGGNMEVAALLAKRALLRPLTQPNPDALLGEMEAVLLERVNDLGIGPLGMGGRTTALGVHIEACPTHIASLPVAVALGCHASRRVVVEL
ncbi:MAG: fumarate hydratase [Syntrophomonadaceae bacterium]|jgi:fumarate hydratase subunit alpha|nr:fumarate hydratase [Syntrophomonadaceae bacterium]